jgi:two-component system sensor histidine kinase/response regulator
VTERAEASAAPPEILIVEDSPVEAEVLRRTLAKAGYAVSVAHDGEVGLQAAREHRPALVMSDINMPMMNGYQLCRALKYDDALWNIPLILLTVLSEPKDIIEAINSGADAYIVKPFAEATLLERIRSLLDAPIERRRADERRQEVVGYGGQRHAIAGGGQQILNLLLSVYENTLNQNRELATTQTQLNLLNEILDQQVQERTAAFVESEQRYRSLFANARDGIVLIDAESGLVADCNPEFEKQCGRPLDELKRLHIWELRPPALHEAARCKFEDVRTTGEGGSSELDFERPDGTRRAIEFASRRIRIGSSNYLQSICRDITERQRVEAELDLYRHHLEELVDTRTRELAEAKMAAEAASAAKSAFVANMSHEIRTPLNAIVGLTHLLRRGHPDPAQKDKLDKIVDASRHLLSVINDILDFSKIEAGKLNLNVTDFAPDRMLDNVFSMIGPKVAEKRLELVVDRDELPPVLVGDSTRLAQALLNYLSNAVKFTEHGRVGVRVSKSEETTADLLVRFEVTDTGIGIAPAKIRDLFAAFEQVDVTTSRRYGGTGLGLAITRRLAHLMGGKAGAQSVPGAGSTFWFTARLGKSKLGLKELSEPLASTELSLHNMPAGTRILLAEDNRINQEVAVELLTEAGLKVEIASNGFEALEKARSGGYDLILMDMQMPGMDGLEATRAIRALPACATLPIIAMTANAFDEDRELCKAAGMNDFVVKPVDPERFFGTLSRWLPAATIIPPTAPAAAEALPAEVAAIPGLDAEQALGRLGRLAPYLRLLREYAVEHADDMLRLRQRMSEGDRDAARRLAHTLKGNSGSMGATDVQRLATELDAAIRAGSDAADIERLACSVDTELQRVTKAILAALPDEAVAAYTGEADWPAVRQVLAELEPMLAASSIRANEAIETHAALLTSALGPLGAELEQRIEHFLYPEALATLQRARQEHPELAP